jgi:hypothetical protein
LPYMAFQGLVMENDIYQWFGVQLPPGAILLYCDSISDWSWGAILVVYQIGNSWFVNESDMWHPEEVTQEDALARMLDFEELA